MPCRAERSGAWLGETGWLAYDFPFHDGPPPSYRLAKFRGQRPKRFALRFTGHDDEVDPLTPRNGQELEFGAWRSPPGEDRSDRSMR